MASPRFRCKKFHVNQEGAAHPVGTDSILIGAWADISGVQRVLDIGTGTGVIALMLAQRLSEMPDFQVDAVEIDENSARCAAFNFKENAWHAYMRVHLMPVQDWANDPRAGKYDLIVSNPPFFTETVLAPEQGRRQARSTVTLHFSDLIDAILRLLSPEGRCCLILPVTEGRRFCEMAAISGLYFTRICRVVSKAGKPVERLMIALERKPHFDGLEDIVLFDPEGKQTVAYRQLTGDFYLY